MKVYIYEEECDWFWYLNVEIYFIMVDFKFVGGLCGFFDGDEDNDLIRRNGLIDFYFLYLDDFFKFWR